jgi:hypothetical protein
VKHECETQRNSFLAKVSLGAGTPSWTWWHRLVARHSSVFRVVRQRVDDEPADEHDGLVVMMSPSRVSLPRHQPDEVVDQHAPRVGRAELLARQRCEVPDDEVIVVSEDQHHTQPHVADLHHTQHRVARPVARRLNE